MMQTALPLTQELVLVGGGHTHALVLKMWGMNPLAGVRVTLINPHPTAPYSGMLPGHIAGHYTRDELDIDLIRLARFCDARVILAKACDLDPIAKTIALDNGRTIPFDVASIDIGITSDLPFIAGFKEHALGAKPLDRFTDTWREICAKKPPENIVMIGGGVGGVELSMAMQHALTASHGAANITLVDRSNILKGQNNRLSNFLRSALTEHYVNVIENAEITKIDANAVHLKDGSKLPSDFTVGAAGARPQAWLETSGLDLSQGFIVVKPTLQSTNVTDIFAVGDCADLAYDPRPKAGVFAVREAPILFHNLRAILSGGTLKEFHPQRDYLKLISLGSKSAVADKWGMLLSGKNLWRIKDRIDRKFMDQFTDLAPMPLPDLPKTTALGVKEALGDKPLCGGCGAKVGGVVLDEVLAHLPTLNRADVLSKPGDDAAILRGPNSQHQVITTDHLRAFTNDPWVMARIAAVHALGDIWAMGAAPQVALSTLVLPRMSPKLQENMLAEIIASAGEIFTSQGAEIVGGHTSLGAELTIGFTVTGLRKAAAITLAGAKAGDIIILSKPLGSGTIMAGEMAMKAKGEWVEAAQNSMTRPQGDAAKILDKAHAMTDVTGFGLAGHLIGIAKASGVTVTVDLDEVPFLDGAIELNNLGVKSSLYNDNRALMPAYDPTGNPKEELLFDPQTAGGLIAAVAPETAQTIRDQLRDLGYDAKIIGRCEVGNPELKIQ